VSVTTSTTFRLARTQSLRMQIADEMRRRIRSGALAEGARLPTARELANQLGTDAATVHFALAALAKEGLLDRTPRVGTFVRRRVEKLTRLGLYYANNIGLPGISRFQQALYAALQGEWARLGVEIEVVLDPRPFAPEMAPWPELERAARERRVQAVIAPWVALPHLAWLDKLPVPTAFLSSSKRPNTVTLDHVGFFQLALGALARQGCKSVAVLPCLNANQPPEHGLRHDYAQVVESLVDTAGDLRLALRNEWVFTPPHYLESQAEVQRFGYEKTRELWRHPERPDGLVVTDDVAATGVVAALLELGVQVPAQLKLVIQKNSAVDIFCPLPASYVEVDTAAIARALVGQVLKQSRGESVQRVVIDFKLDEP